jgi:hypothetical protein
MPGKIYAVSPANFVNGKQIFSTVKQIFPAVTLIFCGVTLIFRDTSLIFHSILGQKQEFGHKSGVFAQNSRCFRQICNFAPPQHSMHNYTVCNSKSPRGGGVIYPEKVTAHFVISLQFLCN